jgi:uncharacterized membrane protein
VRLKILVRRWFVTGLLITLPLAGTYFILRALLRGMEGVLGSILKTHFGAHYYPGLGIAVLIIGIFLVGLLTTNVIGHWVVARYETILERLPLVRTIYSAIKSVVHTISIQGKDQFRGVVLVEFPRAGMYLLAFVVAETKGEIARKSGKKLLNLFVPTAPNPTSGYLVFVPEDDVVFLDISVEEAMKTIISGGIYSSGLEDLGVVGPAKVLP